jgi:hypothetical protein
LLPVKANRDEPLRYSSAYPPGNGARKCYDYYIRNTSLQKKYLPGIAVGSCQITVFHSPDGTDGIGKPLDGFAFALNNRYVQVSALIQGDMLQRTYYFPVYIVLIHDFIKRITTMVFVYECDDACDIVAMVPTLVPEFAADEFTNNFRAVRAILLRVHFAELREQIFIKRNAESD